jgi:hypothetical protein
MSKQRIYASLMALMAGILLYRTILMISQGALHTLVPWVAFLLVVELLVDLSCLVGAIFWWIKNDKKYDRVPLKLISTAMILHFVRMAIFVAGRSGPWIDFDLRPGNRAINDVHWTLPWVYIASVFSVLGLIGAIVILTLKQKHTEQPMRHRL